MKFVIKTADILENPVTMMRRLGYAPHHGTMSFVRRLTHDEFPRLHVHLNDVVDGIEVSLHLDQKRATYGDNTAHSGEYNHSEMLKEEKQRIIMQLSN